MSAHAPRRPILTRIVFYGIRFCRKQARRPFDDTAETAMLRAIPQNGMRGSIDTHVVMAAKRHVHPRSPNAEMITRWMAGELV